MKALVFAACPVALLALAGCGESASKGPERPTMGEARAVGEAAEMLDERPEETLQPAQTDVIAPEQGV